MTRTKTRRRVRKKSTPQLFMSEKGSKEFFFSGSQSLLNAPLISQIDEMHTTRPTLRYGSRGDQVRYLQKRLNDVGAGIVADGIFGPKTYLAVRNFQARYAPPVDGIVGRITWKTLENATSERQKGEEDTISAEDLMQLGQSMFDAKKDLEVRDALAHAMFGKLLQETGDKFLLAAEAPKVSMGIFVLAKSKKTTAKTLVLKSSFDFMLKMIALADTIGGFPFGNTPELVLLKKAITLHAVYEHVTAKLNPQPNDDLHLVLNRVQLMRDFYASFLEKKKFKDSKMKKQNQITGPHRSDRMRLVGMALSDVGKVKAWTHPRYGWRYLKQIYDIALNGNHRFSNRHFKYPTPDYQCAHGDKECVKKKRKVPKSRLVKRDLLGSWCGIGALYWMRMIGQTDLIWRLTAGKSTLASKLKKKPWTEIPKVGDLVIKTAGGHHGIITWVDPKAKVPNGKKEWQQIKVRTVEANAGKGEILHTPSGGKTLAPFDVGAFNPFERKP